MSRLLNSIILSLLFICAPGFSIAQPAGLLYDPDPPANSAYVRVLNAIQQSTVSVAVDGNEHVKKLLSNHVSDYMIIPAGIHDFSISLDGKKVSNKNLDITAGRILTLAFISINAADKPLVFEDQTSKNRLKAMLHVYQLGYKDTSIDITTANLETKVFSNLSFGSSNHIQVNPIQAKLVAVKAGTKSPLVETSISMNQGLAYSLFLLIPKNSKPHVYVVENKIERYTSK